MLGTILSSVCIGMIRNIRLWKLRSLHSSDAVSYTHLDVYKRQVYGVTNCGMESERVYRGLDELTEAKGYLTIVIVKYS